MRHSLDPDSDPYEPDPDVLAAQARAAEDVDPFWEPDDDLLAQWAEEAEVEEATRHLTRYRGRLRSLRPVVRCPGPDGRQLAGLYVYNDAVWLWVEGRRPARSRRARVPTPASSAIWCRGLGGDHPAGCECWVEVVRIDCPGCQGGYRLTASCGQPMMLTKV